MSGNPDWVAKLLEKVQSDPTKMSELMEHLGKIGIAKENSHKFWNTQPVPNANNLDELQSDAPIEPAKDLEQIRQSAITLPSDYEWVDVDIVEPSQSQLAELYELLSENYVEDVESLFRFDYPDKFLDWALKSPGWRSNWHVGIRVKSTKKLVAFVSAIPIKVRIRQKTVPSVEVNFLCVHKTLRSKRLAPVLIKEITRRVHLVGIFQALYTAGVVIPTPISSASQFQWVIEYSEEELAHWLTPVDNVIYTYVVEVENEITDFVSFYILPSSVIGNPLHTQIKAAYSFYYAVQKIENLSALMKDALILANNLNCDVFNCLDILKNSLFIEELKFGAGDGTLQYYMFNWATEPIESREVGVIML